MGTVTSLQEAAGRGRHQGQSRGAGGGRVNAPGEHSRFLEHPDTWPLLKASREATGFSTSVFGK